MPISDNPYNVLDSDLLQSLDDKNKKLKIAIIALEKIANLDAENSLYDAFELAIEALDKIVEIKV